MQNFIVLGYIPGTQIQLTFTAWLVIFTVFVSSVVLAFKRRQIVYRIVARRLADHIDKQQLAS